MKTERDSHVTLRSNPVMHGIAPEPVFIYTVCQAQRLCPCQAAGFGGVDFFISDLILKRIADYKESKRGKMSKDIKTKVERTIRSYDEFFLLSGFTLKQAEQQQDYSFYYCMISMVFCAFSLEAYFNHIGENFFKIWDPKNKQLSIDEKLEKILEIRKLKIDKTKEPFSYLGLIFTYRDNIVHCSSQTISNWQSIKHGEIPNMPLSDWEKMTTFEKAQKYKQNTRDMIYFLSKEIENTDFPLGSPSDAMWDSG